MSMVGDPSLCPSESQGPLLVGSSCAAWMIVTGEVATYFMRPWIGLDWVIANRL